MSTCSVAQRLIDKNPLARRPRHVALRQAAGGEIPRLAGQLPDYIVSKLLNWTKERGQNTAKPDTSAVMAATAHGAFLQALSGPRECCTCDAPLLSIRASDVWSRSRDSMSVAGAQGGACARSADDSLLKARMINAPGRGAAPGSALVIDRAGAPVDFQPLDKRVVDGDDVSGDRPLVAFDLPDLQPLVVEAFELQCEIATHVFHR